LSYYGGTAIVAQLHDDVTFILVGRTHNTKKVVSLCEKKASKGWSDYFGVLSFNELIHETQDIISDLDKEGLDAEVLVRARQAMGEFYTRLESESMTFAKSLLGMKNNVDAKVDTVIRK